MFTCSASSSGHGANLPGRGGMQPRSESPSTSPSEPCGIGMNWTGSGRCGGEEGFDSDDPLGVRARAARCAKDLRKEPVTRRPVATTSLHFLSGSLSQSPLIPERPPSSTPRINVAVVSGGARCFTADRRRRERGESWGVFLKEEGGGRGRKGGCAKMRSV